MPRRIVDPDVVFAKVLRELQCRMCGRKGKAYDLGSKTYVAFLSAHHLLSRKQGGDDVDGNIVPLCGTGTTGCHGMIERRNATGRRLLRSLLEEPELDYLVRKTSWAWIERHYPSAVGANKVPARFAGVEGTGWPPSM